MDEDFCALPQSRPRVWGLFFKVCGGFGPNAIATRTGHISRALEFVRKGMCSGREPLQTLLTRTPTEPYAFRAQKAPSKSSSWKDCRAQFQQKHGLSDEDVAVGHDEFLKATDQVMRPREQQALWLELCRQRKKGRIPNWKDYLLVSDIGSSVDWLSVTKGLFPCLRPGNKYIILQYGAPQIARGPLCLAVQGIGKHEAEATNLYFEDDALIRALAGNAFSANICCVFFAAALMFMDP